MTATLTPTLINKDFQNWLKGALAVCYAKEGLIGLVEHEIIDFQRHLLQTIYTQKGIAPGTRCSSCTTANLLPCPTAGFCSKGKKCKAHDSNVPDKRPNQACPIGLCSHIRDTIRNEHRFKGPSWKNTNARRWCSDAYELSKCFMPPDGYSDKTCLADTDFNGILAIVINNNRFQKKISVNLGLKSNICTEARNIGREIRHSANHLLSDQDLMKYTDDLITLMSDPAYLAADVKANDAVGKLKQLKTNTLTIHAEDITNVLNESIQTRFEDQQKVFLRDIQEHFKKHKSDSVEVLDKKIQESVDKQLAEIKAQTDRGKDELHAEKEKGKTELKLQTKTGKDELQSQLEQGMDALNIQITMANIAQHAQIKSIEHKTNESIVLYTRTVDTVKHKGIEELQKVTKTGKLELENRGKHILEQINRTTDLNYGENGDTLLKGAQSGLWDKITFKESRLRSKFKKELVRFYYEKESLIPASPLVEDHVVPLTELYVQPPTFIKSVTFGQGNKPLEKKRISSYGQLFFKDDNIPYRNIYVEANAGYGKTCFTQKVALTWCQAHKPNKLMKSKFKKEDVFALQRFDFLFLLHLRDFQGDTCTLDNLILKFVSQNLPPNEHFSKQFIMRILRTKTCLVIIDGLDEWVHPETCTRTPGIPHNNYRENCTVLTTTRPWKLSTIGLPPNLIDQHLEIAELDDKTSEELKRNAVKLLSENSGTHPPNLNDFDRKVSSVKLGYVRMIPYILLQLICVWFDGLSIGKSKCETYINTIELTLQRGLKKRNVPTLPTRNAERNVSVPECMRHNVLCNQYLNLLYKLGKLAFCTLFQKIKESSLVIDSTIVLKFLTEEELAFCLKIGLLNQTKDRSKVSIKRYKVFFQHKSVQEFIAALYVTIEWNDETIQSTILEVCSTHSCILEMENLFAFVCGMKPVVYACISGEFQKNLDLDCVTRRTFLRINESKTISSYLSMQVQCLLESMRNGNESCPIYLYVVLDGYLTVDLTELKTIIHFNKGHVKSLLLLNNNKKAAFMQSLDPGVFTSLDVLRVDKCDEENIRLADILTESAHTLKRLTISEPSSRSDISITALTKLTCLQSLYLDHIYMSHNGLKCLYAYISQTTLLTQLNLDAIDCSDHKNEYRDCDVTLNLHRLNELKILLLSLVPCRDLNVNPAYLEKFEFLPLGEKMTANASSLLWQDLRAAPILSSLTLYKMSSCREMIQTIPTFTNLQNLSLAWIDIDDVITLSPAMAKLERVVLHSVTMSSETWRELFLSVDQLQRIITVKLSWIIMKFQEWRELLLSIGGLQHPVSVELLCCQGPSRKEWRIVVDVIRKTPTLLLSHDLSFEDSQIASFTLKKRQ